MSRVIESVLGEKVVFINISSTNTTMDQVAHLQAKVVEYLVFPIDVDYQY